MTLRIASEDIQEVHSALFSAYGEVIRELGQSRGIGSSPARIALCRRRSKLEAILSQLEAPRKPAPVLEMVPRRGLARSAQLAA